MINVDKSAVLFSPNTGDFQRRRVREILNISAETKKNEKYLGFLFQWADRRQMFLHILKREFGNAYRLEGEVALKGRQRNHD